VKYHQVPPAIPNSRIIERVMPMFASFRTMRSSGTSRRSSSRIAPVASVLPSSQTRISNEPAIRRQSAACSRTTAATVACSLSAGMSTES